MSEEETVGFAPVRLCPLCGVLHDASVHYKGIAIVACEKVKEDGVILFNIVQDSPLCCNNRMMWTSYNRELVPDAPADHWTCEKCGAVKEK